LDEGSGQENLVEDYSYDAYGFVSVVFHAPSSVVPGPSSRVGNPYTFTARALDPETGLYYFRARYYSPVPGRFISRDPLAYVDGMNLYAAYFVPNGTDPTGLWYIDIGGFVPLFGPFLGGGGVMIGTGGIFVYVGVGLGMPGGSITVSAHDPTSGISVGVSGFAPVASPLNGAQGGYSFGHPDRKAGCPNTSPGAFYEAGCGTPGANVTVVRVFNLWK
jgi:RHS repeat-associated protein